MTLMDAPFVSVSLTWQTERIPGEASETVFPKKKISFRVNNSK